jgi:dihydrofolate synthase / folylpolyglutamate synthase
LRIVRYNNRNIQPRPHAVALASSGNPQDRFRSVHVAGTKGKGSTCAMIAGMLQACGYKVGLYTSPHLVDVRERIRSTAR